MWLVFILLILSSFLNQLFAQEFEVSGLLTQETFDRDTRLWAVKRHFTVSVNECRTYILTSNENSYISQEAGFENGDIYSLVTFFKTNKVTSAATIRSEVVPIDDGSTINFLWLAYGSACYFSQQTNNHLEPIWTLDDLELKAEHFKVQANYTLSSNRPFLPTSVIYLNDGKLRMNDNGVRRVISAQPPFEKGYTNFVYECLGKTNVGDLQVPSAFKFVRYFISGDELKPRQIVTGSINTYKQGSSIVNFKPKLKSKEAIMDFRFSRSNAPLAKLVYRVDDQTNWTATNLAKLYNKQLKIEKRKKPVEGSSKNKIVLAALILLASCFFIFILRTRNKRF